MLQEFSKEAGIKDLISRVLKGSSKNPPVNIQNTLRNAGNAPNNTGIIEAFGRGKESGGFRGALEEAAKYKDPLHNLPMKSFDTNNLHLPESLKTQGKGLMDPRLLKRGVTASFGNTASNLLLLGKDMKGKGILGKTWQGIKNTGELIARQTRSSMYREIDGEVLERGGKKFIKSKASWLKDREILGETGRGSYIVKKRAGILPVSIATQAPIGGGLTIAALPDKRLTTSQKMTDAVVDTGLFTLNTPVAMANALGRELKRSKNTNQLKGNVKIKPQETKT